VGAILVIFGVTLNTRLLIRGTARCSDSDKSRFSRWNLHGQVGVGNHLERRGGSSVKFNAGGAGESLPENSDRLAHRAYSSDQRRKGRTP